MHQATKKWCGLILATAFTVQIVGPAVAQEKAPTKQQRVAPATQPAHAHRRRGAATRSIAPQPQIACTVIGCNPVPRGCHPEPQRYFSGMTTGFDAIVCP
jgi:hypothetical protein